MFGRHQLRSADSKLKPAASISRLQTKAAFLTAASPGLELLMGPPDFLTQFLWTPGTLEGTVFFITSCPMWHPTSVVGANPVVASCFICSVFGPGISPKVWDEVFPDIKTNLVFPFVLLKP